jgi:hypothetical protein
MKLQTALIVPSQTRKLVNDGAPFTGRNYETEKIAVLSNWQSSGFVNRRLGENFSFK